MGFFKLSSLGIQLNQLSLPITSRYTSSANPVLKVFEHRTFTEYSQIDL